MSAGRIIAVGLAFTVMTFAADPWAGTWKLRSTADNRLTARIITEHETAADTFYVAFDDVSKTGEKTHTDETLICDGKEHLMGTPASVMICKRTGPTTRTLAEKKDGKVQGQVVHSVSQDGKVLTVTNSSTGKVTTYDKQ